LGRYEKAIEYYKKSLEIKEAKNDPKREGIYDILGNAYCQQGQYDDAIPYYKESLRMKKAAVEKDRSAIATLYHKIGNAYEKQKKYKKAIKYYQKLLNSNHCNKEEILEKLQACKNSENSTEASRDGSNVQDSTTVKGLKSKVVENDAQNPIGSQKRKREEQTQLIPKESEDMEYDKVLKKTKPNQD